MQRTTERARDPRSRASRYALPALAGIGGLGALAALGAGALSMAMNFYDHNESVYVSAGWMVAHGYSPYSDFSFWQMPYSALVYAAVFRVFEPMRLLLAAKVTSYACLWLCAAMSFAIGWELTRRTGLSLLLPLALFLNFTIVRCACEASNYIQPILFGLAAFYCALRALHGAARPAFWWCAAGSCAAVSVGFKLYYAPTLAAYLALPLLLRADPGRRLRWSQSLVPLCAGILLGLTPVLWYLARDPRAFVFNNLGAHHVTTAWWTDVVRRLHARGIEPDVRLTLGEKLRFVGAICRPLFNLGPIAGVVACIGVLAAQRSGRSRLCAPEHVLACSICVVSWIAAFQPTPMWYQYAGMPVSFLLLWLAVLAEALRREQVRFAGVVVGGVMVASLSGGAPAHWQALRHVHETTGWAGNVVHRAGEAAARDGTPGDGSQRAASLQALLVVESGRLSPYPELVFAPFTYVIADRLSEEERARYRIAGAADVERLLGGDPPAAVLAGLYDGLLYSDAALEAWAKRAEYRLDDNVRSMRLYLPDAAVTGIGSRRSD